MAEPEAATAGSSEPNRLVAPEATLARLTPHLARLGITRVANVTGLDRIGIPVVTVCRPNARSLAVSQGKGLSLAAAKVSAIMEAVELYHAETISGPLWWVRPDELALGERSFLDPFDLPRSAAAAGYDGPLAWIEAADLWHGGSILVPYACVSADYTQPTESLGAGLSVTTGGLGAGNDRDEALLHGLTELIERDAVTLWRLGGPARRRASTVDPTSIHDPVLIELLDRLSRARLHVRLWEASSDIDVPVFVCLLAGTDADDADPEFGAGCHPRPAVAALRALLEAVQARLTFVAGSRDDIGGELYEPARRARRRREALRWLSEPSPERPFAIDPDAGAASAAAELEITLGALAARGLRNVAAVELTRAEIGVQVVRVLVAGLEGSSDAPDYVPGHRARSLAAG
jgi:YcaO-like protein with predicted kinase domain